MVSCSGCWFRLEGCCFPRLRCSGSRLFYMERALRCLRFQPSGVPQKCLRFVPSTAQAAQAARSLTGALSPGAVCLLPSATPASVSACAGWVHAPCVSLQPSRRMSTIQNLSRSLIRNWRPVCSAVGDAVLGAEPAPFPSPLPPAGGAGLVCSLLALLWTCSDPLFCKQPAVCSGWLIFSLSCCPTV